MLDQLHPDEEWPRVRSEEERRIRAADLRGQYQALLREGTPRAHRTTAAGILLVAAILLEIARRLHRKSLVGRERSG